MANGVFVVETTQGNLLEVVLALRQPRRLARACTAGSSSAIKMPMIVTTTSSSTKVKPFRGRCKRLGSCPDVQWLLRPVIRPL